MPNRHIVSKVDVSQKKNRFETPSVTSPDLLPVNSLKRFFGATKAANQLYKIEVM